MYNVLLVAIFLSAWINFIESQHCPHSCRCNNGRKIVYCNERNLDLIPYGIPSDTGTLHLQINEVRNGPATNEVLSTLRQLKKLDLHQNKLTSVPKGLPSTLEYVDIRSNRIKYVGKTSLKGLTSLAELHLDENNITNQGLSPLAFQDTRNLKVLVLSDNLLTSFPEDLPGSLRILRLNNNRIRFISRKATQRLTNLESLDLSLNVITEKKIEAGSIQALASLRVLEMSQNHLTQIPGDFPETLRTLTLSQNKIEFLFKSKNSDHGSLNTIESLTAIDLSSNVLKSVETDAFSNLKLESIELHNNPWHCDCHLRYLKSWLSSKVTVLSSESNIRCSSPSTFAGVTLNSLDAEALKCASRTNVRNLMSVFNVTSTQVSLLWQSPNQASDPPFVRRSLIYGLLKCESCLPEDLEDFDKPSHQQVTSLMDTYSSMEVTETVRSNPRNASIIVDGLQAGKRYSICVFDSEQEGNSVTMDQCLVVETLPKAKRQKGLGDVSIPLWVILLCSAMVVLLLIIVGIGMAVSKKRNSTKSKTPRLYGSGRDDIVYDPTAYLPSIGSHMTYRSTTQRQDYHTNLSDRTYAECGPANGSGTGRSRTLPNSDVDARMEFQVLLNANENTSMHRTRTPGSSSGRLVQKLQIVFTKKSGFRLPTL